MRKAILAALAVVTVTIISAGSASPVLAQSGPGQDPESKQVTGIGDFSNLSQVLIWPGQNGNVQGVSVPDRGTILIGGLANQIVPGSGLLLQGGGVLGILIPLEPPVSSAIDRVPNDADNRPPMN